MKNLTYIFGIQGNNLDISSPVQSIDPEEVIRDRKHIILYPRMNDLGIHQVVAKKDFPELGVKKGDLGGTIIIPHYFPKNESFVVIDDDSWISPGTVIMISARRPLYIINSIVRLDCKFKLTDLLCSDTDEEVIYADSPSLIMNSRIEVTGSAEGSVFCCEGLTILGSEYVRSGKQFRSGSIYLINTKSVEPERNMEEDHVYPYYKRPYFLGSIGMVYGIHVSENINNPRALVQLFG